MPIDRVVVTTFPGYFFSTVLCLQSVEKFVSGAVVDIIIDDFGLDQWPDYVSECKKYIQSQCAGLKINFYLFSQIPDIDRARAGGWFRQQLIKLHLDQILDTDHWLLIDADVILKDYPDITTVPTLPHPPDPIGHGNRHYVQYMLNAAQPWLGQESETEFICASGIPIRYLSRELLTSLRSAVEQIHKRNFLELHLDLISQQSIVAYDPNAVKMIMSEFQLIEYFRNQCYWQSLPLRRGAPNFYHTSIKDWNLGIDHFNDIPVPEDTWNKLLNFAQTYQ
jgi:hypothetical protein